MISSPPSPLVTVMTTVYNNMPYLPAAVQSILDQTFPDFEYVIVDDGSDDRSLEVLRDFAARDRRIRLFPCAHKGVVAALHEASRHARGKFIAHMDADDISLPQRLARQVEFLRTHPDHVLVGSRALLIDPQGAPICEFAKEVTHEQIDAAHFDLRWPLVHPTVLMRREAFERVGGYRARYESLEDLDLFLRLGEVGKLANLPEVLVHYRQHVKSMCFTFRPQQNSIREAIFREACQRRGIPMRKESRAFIAPGHSGAAVCQRWAWLALEAGNLATARKHALRSIVRQPWMLDSWRVAFCALRGH